MALVGDVIRQLSDQVQSQIDHEFTTFTRFRWPRRTTPPPAIRIPKPIAIATGIAEAIVNVWKITEKHTTEQSRRAKPFFFSSI